MGLLKHYGLMKAWLKKRFRQPSSVRSVYCDYAAATPLLPAVANIMDQLQRTTYGNPGGIHALSVAAKTVITDARRALAQALGVRPAEIFFTASGTEANNLAILGVVHAKHAAGMPYEAMELITTAVEHPSVTETVAQLAAYGVRVHHVPVDEEGHIKINELAALVTERTVLVTFAYAHSEVGTVQRVTRLSRRIKKQNPNTVVHIDAAQAPLWLPCKPHQLGVDLLSLDTGKCNGPKGFGVLVKRVAVPLKPQLHGGGQESGLRASTENTPVIAGGVQALTTALAAQNTTRARAYELAQALQQALVTHVPEAVFNGVSLTNELSDLERLPNNIHISLPGYDTEYAVVYLSQHGIAASTRSACSAAGEGESAVVQAMTDDSARARSTIRFSIDPAATTADMDYVANILRQWLDLMVGFDVR